MATPAFLALGAVSLLTPSVHALNLPVCTNTNDCYNRGFEAAMASNPAATQPDPLSGMSGHADISHLPSCPARSLGITNTALIHAYCSGFAIAYANPHYGPVYMHSGPCFICHNIANNITIGATRDDLTNATTTCSLGMFF
jgi:hypothetical protein